LCDLSDFIFIGYNKDVCSYLLTTSVIIYSNAELQKKSILAENKGKSGIYLWTNKVNDKCYVGSSVDLGKRFIKYFSRSYITDLKNVMLIYKAILAHGYSNFSLEILEYSEPDKNIILEREQYYLDLLKPEYNILSTAGSSLGHKHSKETRDKIRAARLGRSE